MPHLVDTFATSENHWSIVEHRHPSQRHPSPVSIAVVRDEIVLGR
jgi:hypothetical protein